MRKNKDNYRHYRTRNAAVFRRVIRALCIVHRKPMLSDAMTKIVFEFLTDEMPAESLKRLRAKPHPCAELSADDALFDSELDRVLE